MAAWPESAKRAIVLGVSLGLSIVVGCGGGKALQHDAASNDARPKDAPADKASLSDIVEARPDVTATEEAPRDADAAPPTDADAAAPDDAPAPDASADRAAPGAADAPGGDARGADDADVIAVPDAAADGTSDVPARKPRALSLLVYNAPWKGTQRVAGMAVDAKNRVFLEDQTNVYMIENKTVSTYLTLAEATAKAGAVTPTRIADLDLGPDDLLYVLVWAGRSMYIPDSTLVVRSSEAHVAEPWITITANFAKRLSVIGAGKIGVADRDGFETFAADGAGHLVYPRLDFHSGGDCACEDLIIAPSGVIFYQPGCNVAPFYRSNLDGSGVSVWYQGAAFKKPNDTYTPNFLCAARDPAGGFYFMVGDTTGGPFLYHVTENASGTTGLEQIPTDPTFAFASLTQSETFAFRYCSLAAGPDGAVYFHTISQLWKVAPGE